MLNDLPALYERHLVLLDQMPGHSHMSPLWDRLTDDGSDEDWQWLLDRRWTLSEIRAQYAVWLEGKRDSRAGAYAELARLGCHPHKLDYSVANPDPEKKAGDWLTWCAWVWHPAQTTADVRMCYLPKEWMELVAGRSTVPVPEGWDRFSIPGTGIFKTRHEAEGAAVTAFARLLEIEREREDDLNRAQPMPWPAP